MVNKQVPCPQCQRPAVWSQSNPFKPFCSERCKLIDLGAWASEAYSVQGEPLEDISLDTIDIDDKY